jgi:diguanylate cyclase (GGDEF)-like protein
MKSLLARILITVARMAYWQTSPLLVDGTHLAALLDLTDDADENHLLTAATRSVVALLGERGSCVLVDGRPRVVFATETPSLTNWPISLRRYPEIAEALDTLAVVVVEDVLQDPRFESVRALLPSRLCSLAAVPLFVGERRLGVLLAQSSSPRRADPQAINTAALVGQLTARLVEADRVRRAATPISRSGVLETEPRGIASSDVDDMPTVRIRTGTPVPPPPRSSAGQRLLLVEDDADHAAAMSAMLEEGGYRVEVACDGAQGVGRAQKAPPDLILMDVCMPILDGFAAAEQLKSDPLTRDVPILFVSGCDDLPARMRAFAVGGVDFLVKPFYAPELLVRVERSLEQVEMREQLRGQANVDELTGLGNLRFLHTRLRLEQSRSERYGTPLAMLMIDVDKLKSINDQHGHAAGSQSLAAIGRVLREEIRETDVAVRYGGDEFVVMLPHATSSDAMRFAGRVLDHVRKLELGDWTVTVSIGVASLSGAQPADALLEAADAEAYRAKRQGGDCACFHSHASDHGQLRLIGGARGSQP